MKVNYVKLHREVTSITATAALADGIRCRSKSTHSLSPDRHLLLWQMSFCLNLLMRSSKEVFFQLSRAMTTLNCLLQGYGDASSRHYDCIFRDIATFVFTGTFTLMIYADWTW